jgi:hypothetical protein
MDPLSIAASATGLAAFAATLVKGIYDCVEAIKSTDKTLLSLASELSSLSQSLGAVERGLSTPKLKEALTEATTQAESSNYLTSLNDVLGNCKTALKDLDYLLDTIKDGSRLAHGIIRKPVIAWKINSSAPDLGRIKGLIQTYRDSMRVCMLTINL